MIHFSGEPGRTAGASIRRTSREAFLRGGAAVVVRHRHTLPPEQVLERAESRLGEAGYHLLFRNCEHFARWCVGRSPVSPQVETAAWHAVAAGIALGTAARVMARRSAPLLLRRTAVRLLPVASTLVWTGAAIGMLSRFQAQEGRFAPPGACGGPVRNSVPQ